MQSLTDYTGSRSIQQNALDGFDRRQTMTVGPFGLTRYAVSGSASPVAGDPATCDGSRRTPH
jgi:hypothetical protein